MEEQIIKLLENAPTSVKKFMSGLLLSVSLAMSKTEKDMLTNSDVQVHTGDQMHQEFIKSQFLAGLKQGQLNEAYKEYFYKVLKKADEIVFHSTPDQLRTLAEKLGMNTSKVLNENTGKYEDEQFGLYDKKHKHYGKTLSDVYEVERESRTENSNNLPVEIMVANKEYLINPYDSSSGKYYTISCIRHFDTIQKIEQLTENLHIKIIGGDLRVLEFYIPSKYTVKNHVNTKEFGELVNSLNIISFKNEYGEEHRYKIHKYKELTTFNNYDVIKFNGNKIENLLV